MTEPLSALERQTRDESREIADQNARLQREVQDTTVWRDNPTAGLVDEEEGK
jgi:hypothetical protein